MLTPFKSDLSIDWPAYDRLVDWYIASGASGLFAVCLSSEMFLLSEDERLLLAKRAVARARGRVPVIAAGAFGDRDEIVAAFVKRLMATGISAAICLTNQFCTEFESAERWQKAADRILAAIDPSVPLGLYECPQPYPRLLTPAQTEWAARQGRFRFLKDTSCSMQVIRSRIGALRGTGMRLFNANTPTLLDSLHAGARGYSGIAANYMPKLYSWLCANFAAEPATAERLHRFLSVADPLVGARYPASAKTFLHLGKFKISPKCRLANPAFSEEDILVLTSLRDEAVAWHRELGLGDIIFDAPSV